MSAAAVVAMRWLGTARVIALTPLVILFMLVYDLRLRMAIALGKEQPIRAILAGHTHGLMWMLKVCWGVKLKVDPRLTALLSTPGCTIVVANHRSPLDILVLMHMYRARAPHFVCRPGLEQGVPLISPLVRYLCAVLSGTASKNNALLRRLGQKIAATGGVGIIFPEGRKTQHNYPDLLPFQPGGLSRLAEAAPSARVVAVALRGTHEAWPGPWGLPKSGVTIEATLAACVSQEQFEPRQLARHCEAAIRSALARPTESTRTPEGLWTSSPTH